MICLHILWTKSPNSVTWHKKCCQTEANWENCPKIGGTCDTKSELGDKSLAKFRKIPTLILINVKTKKQRKTLKSKNLHAHKRQNSSIWNLSPVKHATFLRKRRKHQFNVKVPASKGWGGCYHKNQYFNFFKLTIQKLSHRLPHCNVVRLWMDTSLVQRIGLLWGTRCWFALLFTLFFTGGLCTCFSQKCLTSNLSFLTTVRNQKMDTSF